MTSPNSTAIYSEGDLSKLLNYVKEIRQVGGNHGFSACVVGKSGVSISSSIPHGFLRSLDVFLQYVVVRG